MGVFEISIPAFREEGDGGEELKARGGIISIPAFREEGDGKLSGCRTVLAVFQSPPSVRKATLPCPAEFVFASYFNPRLP